MRRRQGQLDPTGDDVRRDPLSDGTITDNDTLDSLHDERVVRKVGVGV